VNYYTNIIILSRIRIRIRVVAVDGKACVEFMARIIIIKTPSA
jgi:hypothetical protein